MKVVIKRVPLPDLNSSGIKGTKIVFNPEIQKRLIIRKIPNPILNGFVKGNSLALMLGSPIFTMVCIAQEFWAVAVLGTVGFFISSYIYFSVKNKPL